MCIAERCSCSQEALRQTRQVLLEGTTLLLDTSGILDTVLGAMSMAFILEVDEMLCLDGPRSKCEVAGCWKIWVFVASLASEARLYDYSCRPMDPGQHA